MTLPDPADRSAQRVTIYGNGPLTLSVCAPRDMAVADVIADVERQNPCGTTHGWQVSSDEWLRWDAERNEKVPSGRHGPIPCDQYPDSHIHWLFTA